MSKQGARILVVDDEKEMVQTLSRSLSARGYRVLSASTGEEALKITLQQHPDLLLLDLLLPDISGLQVCQQVREVSNVPIIVLSVKEAERDKVEALDVGADDYVQKPFGMNEVLARVRVALRYLARIQVGMEPPVQIGPLQVDFARHLVKLNGQPVALTPTEYNLLKVLLSQRGKILTRQMLLREVWGTETRTSVHSLHVSIANLRQKIEPDPFHPCFIVTLAGVGYRFSDELPEKE